jgi:Lar family restriction alleviation protein
MKLKLCPFCGCEAWLHSHGSIFSTGNTIGHRIECEGSCHAMTCYWHTKEQAIEAWNRRTPVAEPQADAEQRAISSELLDAVKDALAFLDRPDITTYEWYKLAPDHVGKFRRAIAKAEDCK